MSSTENPSDPASKKNAIKCHICSKVFYRHDVFRCHLRIHNNDKPYACSICGKRFAHHGNKNQHETTHLNSFAYKCDFCDKACSSKIYLNRHVKKRHPEVYVPSKKGQVLPERRSSKTFFNQNFKEMKNLTPGSDETSFKCGVCEKPYANKVCLNMHVQKMHPGLYSLSKKGQGIPEQGGSKQLFVKQNVSEMKKPTFKCKTMPYEKAVSMQCSNETEMFQSLCPNGMTQQTLSMVNQWAGRAEGTTGVLCVPVNQKEVNSNIFRKSDNTASASSTYGISVGKINGAGMNVKTDSTISSNTNTVNHEKVYIPPTLQIATSTPCRGQEAERKLLSGLKCPFCVEVFEQRHKYQLHIMMHELEQGKTCTVCNQTFPSLPEKKKHELSHSSETNLTDKNYIPLESLNNCNGLPKQNMPALKGFSAEDLKVVGMIYTVTGADGQMNSQHGRLESSDSPNSVMVKTEIISDTDSM